VGDLIEIRVERTVDGLDMVVQDNGVGIPADKLPIIMEPFGQVESSYARSQGAWALDCLSSSRSWNCTAAASPSRASTGEAPLRGYICPGSALWIRTAKSTVALAGRLRRLRQWRGLPFDTNSGCSECMAFQSARLVRDSTLYHSSSR